MSIISQSLCKLLIDISTHELNVENLRQSLAKIPDFEPFSIFSQISKNGKINCSDLINLLKRYNNIEDSPELRFDINKFIKFYDKDLDEELSYIEFVKFILPKEDSGLRSSVSLRKINSRKIFNSEFEKKISALILEEINNLKETEKNDIFNILDETNILEIFAMVDKKQLGFWDFDCICNFLKNYILCFDDEQVIFILRRFNSQNGRISVDEFQDFVKIFSQNFKFSRLNKSQTYFSPKKIIYQRDPNTFSFEKKIMNENFQKSDQKNTTKNSEKDQYYYFRKNLETQLQNVKFQTPNKKPFNNSQEKSTRSKTPLTFQTKIYNENQMNNYKLIKEIKTTNSKNIKKTLNYNENEKNESKNLRIFLQLLKEIAILENKIETIKQALSLKEDFAPLDCFRFCDTLCTGFVTFSQFVNFFETVLNFPSKNEIIETIFKRLDVDCNGKLKFSEFFYLFLPYHNEYFELLTNRKSTKGMNYKNYLKKLSENTKDILSNLLEVNIEKEDEIEKKKNRIFFDLNSIFLEFPFQDYKFLSKNELKKAFDSINIFITNKEVNLLIRRFDKDEDGFITFSDLIKEFGLKKR